MSTELFSTLPYKVADITLADFGRKIGFRLLAKANCTYTPNR